MIDMKFQGGFGTENQSKDEISFMCYYNLVKYKKNPEFRSLYAFLFLLAWEYEAPELNPFLKFSSMAACQGLSFDDSWRFYGL